MQRKTMLRNCRLVCTTNNTDIQQREEVSTTQALMENSRYCYVQQSLNIQRQQHALTT